MLPVEQATAQKNNRPPPPEHRWKPGQSGNPAGRPKRRVHVRELIRVKADEFRDALLDLAKNGKDEPSRLEALRLAMAYLSGPPPANAVDPPEESDVGDLTAEQAAALLDQQQRAA